MISEIRNVFHDIPPALQSELFRNLVEGEHVRIERIVSDGHATPDGQWYDQSWDEWVILLSGSAGLRFEDEDHERRLSQGDHVLIPAGCRHRVNWTDPEHKTVWLAVHIKNFERKENMPL